MHLFRSCSVMFVVASDSRRVQGMDPFLISVRFVDIGIWSVRKSMFHTECVYIPDCMGMVLHI